MNKFVDRFSNLSSGSRPSSSKLQLEDESSGYALPMLGKGLEMMPMPTFAMPSTHDVSFSFTFPLSLLFRY